MCVERQQFSTRDSKEILIPSDFIYLFFFSFWILNFEFYIKQTWRRVNFDNIKIFFRLIIRGISIHSLWEFFNLRHQSNIFREKKSQPEPKSLIYDNSIDVIICSNLIFGWLWGGYTRKKEGASCRLYFSSIKRRWPRRMGGACSIFQFIDWFFFLFFCFFLKVILCENRLMVLQSEMTCFTIRQSQKRRQIFFIALKEKNEIKTRSNKVVVHIKHKIAM